MRFIPEAYRGNHVCQANAVKRQEQGAATSERGQVAPDLVVGDVAALVVPLDLLIGEQRFVHVVPQRAVSRNGAIQMTSFGWTTVIVE